MHTNTTINIDMEKHVMDGASDGNNTNHTSPSSCVDDNNNKLYKGVRKRKWGKWVSEIRLPNSRERIWLGSYDSPEKAARAFDAALYCLRGRHANFNFPNTPCNMDTNVAVQSLTPQEIQEVAAKFANHDPLLLKPLHQEQSSDGGNADSSSKSINTIYTPTSTNTASSSSCSTTMMHECDGKVVQVDHGEMDWTFLNVFDSSNEVFPVGVPDYDIYSELHKMHSGSGELLYSTPVLPPPFEGNQGFIEPDDDDPFSHQSFPWNWNF